MPRAQWRRTVVEREITLEVPGLPPLKNEAISLFSKVHGQHDAVRLLLQQTRAALPPDGRTPFGEAQRLGLEVVIESPEESLPGDATNYLGGIADVLEDNAAREKQRPGALGHLGDLRAVALYPNDRQIREVRYRHLPGETQRYTVRVWALPDEGR
jgi:hypothetical protein